MTDILLGDVNRDSIDLSIVIPVYNERESLKLLHQKLVSVLSNLDLSWEIVYVDDGSNDGSTVILKEITSTNESAIVAVQRRNFGKSLALAAGFALARGQVLITMDADLQDEPEEIPHLLSKLAEEYDVVVGWRQRRLDGWSKRLPSWIANKMTTFLTGLPIQDMNSGLKAYRRECVQRISLYGDMHRYIPVIAHFMGYRITEVPVVHHKRQFGKSKYNAMRLLRGGLDLVTVLFLHKYGRRPLHLFGVLGGILLLLGILINVSLIVGRIETANPIGNRPALLFGILLMLMGVQLLSLGLLAELLVAYIQKSENPLSTATVYRGGSKPLSRPLPTGKKLAVSANGVAAGNPEE